MRDYFAINSETGEPSFPFLSNPRRDAFSIFSTFAALTPLWRLLIESCRIAIRRADRDPLLNG